MSNTYLTPTAVMRKTLSVFHNNLAFARNINRDYDDQFAKSGGKIGSTLKLRLPNRFTVRTGASLSAQTITEPSTTLTVATQNGVDMNFSTADLTLSIDDFAKRYIEPAAKALASKVDATCLGLTSDIYHSVGTPGTTPATALVLLQAQQKMDEMATTPGNRFCTVNPAANASLVDGLKGLFVPQGTLSEQFKKGAMGANVLGFDEINMDQNVSQHTNGAWGTTITVTTTSTEADTTLAISFTGSSSTWKVGDVFTIANVYAINPENYQSTGSLQQFTVTANNTGSSTIAALAISPAIITTGAYQTVNSLPVATAAITMLGSASTAYPQNIAYHRDAFTLVTADLEMPQGVHFAAREVFDGISIRIVRQYDINNDNIPCRLDILYGAKTVRPSMACRVWG